MCESWVRVYGLSLANCSVCIYVDLVMLKLSFAMRKNPKSIKLTILKGPYLQCVQICEEAQLTANTVRGGEKRWSWGCKRFATREIDCSVEDPQTHIRTQHKSSPWNSSQQSLTAETLRSFCVRKVHSRTHNRAPLVPDLIHMDQVNTHQFYFSQILVNTIIAIPTPRSTDLQFYDECAWSKFPPKLP